MEGRVEEVTLESLPSTTSEAGVLDLKFSDNADRSALSGTLEHKTPWNKIHLIQSQRIQFAIIMSENDEGFKIALEEARTGASEGGIPIGACLVDKNGKILGRGHNMRIQKNSPILHVCAFPFVHSTYSCILSSSCILNEHQLSSSRARHLLSTMPDVSQLRRTKVQQCTPHFRHARCVLVHACCTRSRA
jgi:hypothetical protein